MDIAQKKQRKIKRFKRTRMWQTFLAMVGMILLVVLAWVLYIYTFPLIIAVSTVEQSAKEMDALVEMLETNAASDLEQQIRDLGSVDPEHVYIYDGAGTPLYRGGKLTPPIQEEERLNLNRWYQVFVGDVVGEYGIYQAELTESELDSYYGDMDEFVEEAVEAGAIHRFSDREMPLSRFWYSAAGDAYQLYVEHVILMDYKDKLMNFFSGMIMSLLFLIPFINFLVSSIRSIISQNRLVRLYYLDTVTMGKNWLFFKERAGRRLRRRNRKKDRYAVICLHMDKYRNYCTCYGTAEGERLLERIDDILQGQMKKKEVFAHYTDGEFGLLLRDIPGEPFEQRLYSLMSLLAGAAGGRSIHFGIGICVVTDWSNSPEECYVCASMARATLGADSPQQIVWFNDQMKQERIWERHVEDTMYQALANGEFQVYVQPKYDPVTETLTGGEALIRWISPQDGFIGPGKFIPIFEKNGFITRIDDFMVSQVAKLQAGWIAEGKQVVPISVNLSRAHFADPALPEHICELVDAYKVPHPLIELEITESVFFDDKAALLSAIDRLHSMGFEISMDDFGSGYSSLNSLKDLSLDVLKLDGEFFRGKQEEGRGDIVVEEAIKLAKRLNMRIVAEGVEHKEQVEFLADRGCDMIQGFYFAKPMPSAEFAERLTAGNA